MNSAIDDMDDLIGKVLAGEATPEERQEVEAWCSASEANQKYFNHLKTIFEKASLASIQVKFNTDAGWQKVKKQISSTDRSKEERSITLWPALRIAASLLLIAAASFATYKWWKNESEPLLVASGTKTLQDVLPDSSAIFLNKNSSVEYQYDPLNKTRSAKLVGEGFFEVKHEEKKPFVIQADEVFIRDIGTAFNVNSYPDKDSIEVMVESGEVQIYTKDNPGLILTAGETGYYSRSKKLFSKTEVSDANTLAYKTGVLSFHSTDLQSVVDLINDLYESNVKLDNKQLRNCRLTATFVNEKIDKVLEIIAETMNLTVERRGIEIILNGEGCQ